MTQITSAHFSLSTPVGSNVRRDWLRSQFGTMAVYSTWNPLYTRRTSRWTPSRNYYGPRYIRSRTSRRKANAEARAARQQRDVATVTINRVATVQVQVPVGDANGAVTINHWNQLRLSSFFPNYAPMYDQMKLDKIRVKITGFRAGTAQTANISPSVVLAFDRNGLNDDQVVSTATISTYSSAQLKQWSTGNAFVMYQNIYPSTIMEKGQYIPTESLVDPEIEDVVDNPCVNESSSTLPFKPLTMIGVDLGTAQEAIQTFAFTAEYEYTVTFRGMRKPSIGSSTFPTVLTKLDAIYQDIDSTPIPIPGTGWIATTPLTTTISVPSGHVLIVDWRMPDDGSHVIHVLANSESGARTYTITSDFTAIQGYYIVFDAQLTESAIYVGNKTVPLYSVAVGSTVASTSRGITLRFAHICAYPYWE